MRKFLMSVSMVAILTGCSVGAINSYPVTNEVTRSDNLLRCFEMKALEKQIRKEKGIITVSVGNVDDYSGKLSLTEGRKVSSGISHMVTTALAKTNVVRVVERIDDSVFSAELNMANNKILGESFEKGYRKIFPGQVLGSDYYITGGITEINYIVSGGTEAYINGIGGGSREYIMEIAADFRLVNTRTTEIVKAVSLRKKIVGKEVKAGVFSFFGDTLVDINTGFKIQEPLNVGVRNIVETSVALILADIYDVDVNSCTDNEIISVEKYSSPGNYPGGFKRYIDTEVKDEVQQMRVRIFGLN